MAGETARLELCRPWTVARIPAYIDNRHLFSQCGTMAPASGILMGGGYA